MIDHLRFSQSTFCPISGVYLGVLCQQQPLVPPSLFIFGSTPPFSSFCALFHSQRSPSAGTVPVLSRQTATGPHRKGTASSETRSRQCAIPGTGGSDQSESRSPRTACWGSKLASLDLRDRVTAIVSLIICLPYDRRRSGQRQCTSIQVAGSADRRLASVLLSKTGPGNFREGDISAKASRTLFSCDFKIPLYLEISCHDRIRASRDKMAHSY